MTENNMLRIGGILLAAGGSSRLGQPKQLLSFKGKTLIRRAAETLVESECSPIVVVLGAEIERSMIELRGLAINVCINENWHDGMSTSIVAGLNSMLEIEPRPDAVVITLCDQPHVNSLDVGKLITAYNVSRPQIVTAKYGETIGVPALFSSKLFDELFQLKGDRGANALIKSRNDVLTVDLTAAACDIDTEVDLTAMLENCSQF